MDQFFIVAMVIFALLFGGIFILFGVLLVGAGLSTLRDAFRGRHWLQVIAVIEISTVEQVTRTKGAMFKPVVSYAYSTASGTFTSRRIGFAERLYATEASARRALDRYPVGTTIMARCNPEDPAEAVLEIRWLDGAAVVFFGILCWIFPVGTATAAGVSWSVSAGVLAGLLAVPAALIARQQQKLCKARREGLYPPPGGGSDAHVASLMAHGEKSLAIRLYRELHGGGLKDARFAVEEMYQRQGPTSP